MQVLSKNTENGDVKILNIPLHLETIQQTIDKP